MQPSRSTTGGSCRLPSSARWTPFKGWTLQLRKECSIPAQGSAYAFAGCTSCLRRVKWVEWTLHMCRVDTTLAQDGVRFHPRNAYFGGSLTSTTRSATSKPMPEVLMLSICAQSGIGTPPTQARQRRRVNPWVECAVVVQLFCWVSSTERPYCAAFWSI